MIKPLDEKERASMTEDEATLWGALRGSFPGRDREYL